MRGVHPAAGTVKLDLARTEPCLICRTAQDSIATVDMMMCQAVSVLGLRPQFGTTATRTAPRAFTVVACLVVYLAHFHYLPRAADTHLLSRWLPLLLALMTRAVMVLE